MAMEPLRSTSRRLTAREAKPGMLVRYAPGDTCDYNSEHYELLIDSVDGNEIDVWWVPHLGEGGRSMGYVAETHPVNWFIFEPPPLPLIDFDKPLATRAGSPVEIAEKDPVKGYTFRVPCPDGVTRLMTYGSTGRFYKHFESPLDLVNI